MNLFGIGPAELIAIVVIAVLVFGPEKVPEAARKAGKWYSEFRRLTHDVTSQFTQQLDVDIREEGRSKAAGTDSPATDSAATDSPPSLIDGQASPATSTPEDSQPPDEPAGPEAGK